MTEDFFEIRQHGCNLYAHIPNSPRGWDIVLEEYLKAPPVKPLGSPMRVYGDGKKIYQVAKKILQGQSIEGIIVNAYFLLGFGTLDAGIYHEGFKMDVTQENNITTYIQPYNVPTKRLAILDKGGNKFLWYPEHDCV